MRHGLSVLPCALLLACGGLPDGVTEMAAAALDYPDDQADQGEGALAPTVPEGAALALTPPISLPAQAHGRSRTRVFLSVPDGETIGLDPSGELRFPPGTRADRVEEVKVRGTWSIADIRGETLTQEGGRFHLLRPDGEGRLSGYAWDRTHHELDTFVHELMAQRLRDGHGQGEASPTRRESMANGLMARAGCARCHGEHQPEGTAALAPVRRGTDGHGWYVPRYVLRDEAPLETYRPDDPNEGPWVSVRCGDRPGERVHHARGRRWVCANGETPVARFDVAAALNAGDPHAQRVCASRRWLFSRMTAEARAKFAPAFEVCGIEVGGER